MPARRRTYPRVGRGKLVATPVARRQARERSPASEQQLHEILDKLAAGVVQIDVEGYYLYVNRRAAADFGLTPADMIGKSLADILTPEAAHAYLERNRRFIADQAYEEREATFDLPIGPRTFFIADQVLSDAQGVGRVLLASTIDITARKADEEALRRSERTFRELYEHMRDAFVSVDMQGRISQYNRSFQELLGYSAEELARMTYEDLTPARWHEMETRIVREEVLSQGYSALYEKEYRHKDGSIVPIELRAVLTYDEQGQPAGIWAIVRDITERRHDEDLVVTQRDLARLLATVTNADDAWPRCLELALRVTGMDSGGLYLFDAQEQALELVCHQGLSEAFLELTARYPMDSPNAQRMLAGELIYYSVDKAQRHTLLQHDDLTCAAIIPIHHQGKILGCVNLASHTLPEVPPFARRALETIAPEIGNIVVALRTAVALRDSQLRVELALQGANLGTWDWELQTGRTVFDERWAEIVGYTLAELEPVSIQTWKDLCHPEDLQRSEALLQKHIAGESASYECEARMRHKNGSWVWVIDRGKVAARGADGTPLRMAGTHLDITARKQAELALRELNRTLEERVAQRTAEVQDLYEHAPIGYHSLDPAGNLVRVNQTTLDWLGYTREELLGHHMTEFLTEQGWTTFTTNFPLLQERGWVRDIELELIRKDGSTFPVLLSATAVYDAAGAFVMTRTTLTDLTEHKQAEETLRQANTELARAARAKDEFLATMSHELRTPLNAILGYSESMQDTIYGSLNERQQVALRAIETSGRHLLALINDILDLSKVEAGRLTLAREPCEIAEVCQASIQFVKELAVKKAIQLSFQLSNHLAMMEADPRRLKQMLVNLLSNAVKFTPDGGQVSLEVVIDTATGVVRFTVRDTGIGIGFAEQARLFQPFVQLDSSLSRQHVGTGLGLALVRRLAELHGGSVSVVSEVGAGSSFTLVLPHQAPPAEERKATQTPQARGTGKTPMQTALVVEDSANAGEQLARYLREANIYVSIHTQGAGALAQAITLQPDIIILDLLLPDHSGWSVLAQLKADQRTREIPVIIVSVVDDRLRGLMAGAVEHLVKPVSREQLWQALREVAAPSELDAPSDEPPQATAVADPAGEPPQATAVADPAGEPRPASLRVLIVEDNELTIQATCDYLAAKGFTIRVARNGHEALAAVAEEHPDLILMDIQLPEIDGLELVRQLRTRPAFATTPILALTALAMPGDKERCLEAGANAYLTKPVRFYELLETIQQLMGA